jgi:FlaA1/EpsC-like NDP-sugar epimerase
LDKRIANFLVIALLTTGTFAWTFFIFHLPIEWDVVLIVMGVRMLASLLIFQDYSLSWSKSTPKTFLIKSFVYIVAFIIYTPFFYTNVPVALLVSELLLYLFVMSFAVYFYYFLINRSRIEKTRNAVIYGAGKAGIKLEEELRGSEYKIRYFIDDDRNVQKRSVDGVKILSEEKLKSMIDQDYPYDLLVIAMPR